MITLIASIDTTVIVGCDIAISLSIICDDGFLIIRIIISIGVIVVTLIIIIVARFVVGPVIVVCIILIGI